MKQSYWHTYVQETDVDEIERHLQRTGFTSSAKQFELMYFETGKSAPSVLISPGSGPGHVFTELAYHMQLSGYNVFMMPNNGGYTIRELMPLHKDALGHIATYWNDRIGGYAEGLGGFVLFYLALMQSPLRSVVLQNAPAILTEEKFRDAILQGPGVGNLARSMAKGRRLLFPLAELLVRIAPGVKVPTRWLYDWKALVDTKEGNREGENRIVEGYLHDPDFRTWYPVAATMSLLTTPPPQPLTALRIPTMFMVSLRGAGGSAFVEYLKDLYHRLPDVKKRLVEVDGSVYWMVSHPKEAASVICEWFDETLL